MLAHSKFFISFLNIPQIKSIIVQKTVVYDIYFIKYEKIMIRGYCTYDASLCFAYFLFVSSLSKEKVYWWHWHWHSQCQISRSGFSPTVLKENNISDFVRRASILPVPWLSGNHVIIVEFKKVKICSTTPQQLP